MEREGFVRLSIDEEIWGKHGRYGIDYPEEKLEDFKKEAECKLRNLLIQLISKKQQIVIDFSFWELSRRNEYKQLIEKYGGIWKLIYLKVHRDELRKRLEIRNKRSDANSFPVTDDLLNTYLTGFETPSGEGEIIV